MPRDLRFKIFIIFLLLILPISIFAHPGRTNVNGCHTNRKTGEYHCHNKPTTITTKKAKTEARTSANTEARKFPPTTLKNTICSYNVYNCSDFSTNAEAQAVFEYCGGINNDIHDLDRDNDSLACESLP